MGFLLDTFRLFVLHLNALSRCFLASQVSDEKSDNLVENCLYITSCFVLAILSLWLTKDWLQFPQCVSEFIFLGIHWASWMSHPFWDVFSFSDTLFDPIFHVFLGMSQWVCWFIKHITGPLGSTHYFSVFSFFCLLDSVLNIILFSTWQIVSSSYADFYLNHSSEVFTSVNEGFAPEFLSHVFHSLVFFFFSTAVCGLWDLNSLTRDWTWVPDRAWSLNYWTSRDFPLFHFFLGFLSLYW